MGDLMFLASTYLAQRLKLSVTVTGVRPVRKMQHALCYSGRDRNQGNIDASSVLVGVN